MPQPLIGIVGLGYVGLPLVRAFVSCGAPVIGFDVDDRKVDSLHQGKSYIRHLDSSWLKVAVENKTFRPTHDMNRLDEPDVIIICVPTPLNASRDPDMSYIENTTIAIAKKLRAGQLVVLESTTYPGTTRDVVKPILDKTGLKCGSDYFLAFSPEREDPGNQHFTTQTIPKVVGGIDKASLSRAVEVYSLVMKHVVPVASCEVAEASKILENTYRSVNIAMVNELKLLFMKLGIDIWEVIEAAKSKPFGFQAFYPGPGLGGHCIPIDPFYLTWLARCHEMPTRFIELAGEINTSMPRFVVDRVAEALNGLGKAVNGARIGILGVAYKKNIDDPRESPSFKLMELLLERGAILSYSDPHVPTLPKMRSFHVPTLSSQDLTAEYLSEMDCVLIATDHSAFDYEFIVAHSKLVVDTRNATLGIKAPTGRIWKA
ncbi:MAG: nucleotide sugar dehydrogenase [Pirellula sp.]